MDGRALLAWNLRRLRAERGLSQERIAADTGIDRAYISEIEREQGNATVDLLDKLASLMGVEIADFFAIPPEGQDRPKPLPQGRRRGTG